MIGVKSLCTALCFTLSLLPVIAPMASEWASVAAPTHEAPRAIGQTNNGCLAGAAPLPLEGRGYMVMHLERHRHYGHPSLVRAIQTLGEQAAQRTLGVLQIGDLGQPRGGPMPFGHRSHQTGLDADIWFNLDPSVYGRADAQRANISAPSLLTPSKQSLDHLLWSERHITLMELAARIPEVDRIFVNPYIKQELCRRSKGSWLRKIRPWYGHDDHFHMRLVCPSNSPDCQPQEAIPSGDGCDASLNWWFEPHPPGPPPPPKPPLPAECLAVLGKP